MQFNVVYYTQCFITVVFDIVRMRLFYFSIIVHQFFSMRIFEISVL